MTFRQLCLRTAILHLEKKKTPDSFTAFLEIQRVRLRRWNLRRAVLQGQIIKRGKNWGLSKGMRESERGVKRRRKHGSCLFLHPSVRSAGGALFTQLCMCVGVGWGQEEREGKRKSGEMVGGDGGLSVISPEGDNGRGAHCNGCHVVPSLHN